LAVPAHPFKPPDPITAGKALLARSQEQLALAVKIVGVASAVAQTTAAERAARIVPVVLLMLFYPITYAGSG
jgi:hypothetical protein